MQGHGIAVALEGQRDKYIVTHARNFQTTLEDMFVCALEVYKKCTG